MAKDLSTKETLLQIAFNIGIIGFAEHRVNESFPLKPDDLLVPNIAEALLVGVAPILRAVEGANEKGMG
jgi:hypothetical protein